MSRPERGWNETRNDSVLIVAGQVRTTRRFGPGTILVDGNPVKIEGGSVTTIRPDEPQPVRYMVSPVEVTGTIRFDRRAMPPRLRAMLWLPPWA